MKKFIGGVVFGIVVSPCLTYLTSILETTANLVITKLSVIIATDAEKLEAQEEGPVHAIGFSCPDEEYEMEEENE